MASLTRLCKRLGHHFKDEGLLERAITHRSAGRFHNERFEFLGDAILGFLISEYLHQRFEMASEGDLSRIRASLVQRSTLAEVARELGLGPWLILGPGETKSGGARRDSILADAVEAIISAVYLDAGMTTCRERLLAWYGSRLEVFETGETVKDAKTRLQEWLQARRQPLPVYTLTAVEGEDHDQRFHVQCQVVLLAAPVEACAATRREAEQQAASVALAQLLKNE
jgi:ribonuclease III